MKSMGGTYTVQARISSYVKVRMRSRHLCVKTSIFDVSRILKCMANGETHREEPSKSEKKVTHSTDSQIIVKRNFQAKRNVQWDGCECRDTSLASKCSDPIFCGYLCEKRSERRHWNQ